MAELRYAVHGVTDSAGVSHSFVPGDTVPAWAIPKITNAKAWAVLPVPVEVPPVKPKRRNTKET